MALGQPVGLPVVALLDGLPLQAHRRLQGRLIVDDPDGFELDYIESPLQGWIDSFSPDRR